MSKTLIISDNEILNQLYTINFEIYLATKVVLSSSSKQAQELLLAGEEYDLIVAMSMMNGNDSALELNNFLVSHNLKIPIIVIGNSKELIPGAIIVQHSYHLEILLRACAKSLGVTAKSMAMLPVSEYFSIASELLMRLTDSPCPVYLKVKKSGEESTFVMVANKGSDLSGIMKKFKNEEVESFFVNCRDRLAIAGAISAVLCHFIQNHEHAGVEEKISAMDEGFYFASQNFAQSPESANEVINIAHACAKMMDEVIKDMPRIGVLLTILANNKNGYVYTHSIFAAFVAAHIVRNVSWGGVMHIEKVNFVLFFHDIMLAPLYLKHPGLKFEEDLLFSEDLNDKEKEIVLNHARLAAELIVTYKKCPLGVDLLVKQHHGMTTGVGFATNFKDDISPLSKIIIISEAFVEEFMRAQDDDPNGKFDMKKIMKILNAKFKKHTYLKIIETFETLKL